MRILAIRGENLASLAGPFAIDFTAEPLAGTGLFAITGDTGAGKSTILDALCLALYGVTPRTKAQRRNDDVADPGGAINASDARNILRRGAGSGFAETDFIAQDGKSYSARWQVRRARGKPDGTLLDADRSLKRLDDGSGVVAGKRAVLEAVEVLTGFTFDQFRRTVLLAQGEFDTFLLADDSERAELLEKITGLDVYARVSRQVFEETAAREQATVALASQRSAIPLMDEAARAALDLERTETAAAISRHTVEAGRLSALIAHGQKSTEAAALVKTAITEHEHARIACDAAAPARERLAEIDAVAPLRPLAETVGRITAETVHAQSAVADALAAAAHTGTLHETAAKSLAMHEAAEAVADDTFARHEPAWQRAIQLDAQIAAARVALAKSEEAAAAARNEAGQTTPAGAAPTGAAAIGAAIQASQAEIETARQRKSALEAEIKDRRTALSVLAPEELAARDGRLRDFERETATALDLANRHAAAAEALDQASADAAAAGTLARDAFDRLAAASAEHRRLAAARSDIAPLASLADAQLAESAVNLRSTLVPGEPCPVCGAPDHPVTQEAGAGARLAQEIRARRDALDASLDTARTAANDAKVEVIGAQDKIERAARARDSATASLEKLVPPLNSVVSGLDAHATTETLPAPISGAPDALRALAQNIDAARAGLAARRKQADHLNATLERLRHGLDAAVHAIAIAAAELTAHRDRAALAPLLVDRQSLLGGEAVDGHRKRIQDVATVARTALEVARKLTDCAKNDHAAASAHHAAAGNFHAGQQAKLAHADAAFTAAAAKLRRSPPDILALLAVPPATIASLREAQAELAGALAKTETTLATRRHDHAQLISAQAAPDHAELAAMVAQRDAAGAARDQLLGRMAQIAGLLADDKHARMAAASLEATLAISARELEVWRDLNAAIGQKDGAKFRRFAQGVTLGELVALANGQLAELNPRYALNRGAGTGLALEIVDSDMAGEIRSPRSLSGGERFLVSLALALALAGLEGGRSFVDSLFIDEGFGALDRETLDVAIDALERLQSQGRKVGVITHVEAMVERIGVQVRVEKRGGGRSTVSVRDGAAGTAG